MKKLVYFSMVGLLTGMIMSFVGCGSSGGGGGAAAVPAPGIGGTGVNVNIGTCQVGQIYSPSYGCLNQGSCPASYGYVPSIQQCIQGTVVSTQTIYGSAPSVGRFFGTMSISNPSQFALLLKYARLCDPYWVGWNFGSWECDNWSRSGYIQLQYFGGNSAATTNSTMYIGAGSTGYGGNYSYGGASGTIGFSQQARVMDNNNSTGMYIDGIGPDGSGVGIKLVVNTGNFVSNSALSSFSAAVYYQGVQFATVNFSRY